MKTGDLREDHGPENWRPSPLITDDGGGARTGTTALMERRVKWRFLGLLPVAGGPEVAFDPIEGLRVEADGFETWVKFLNDVEPDDGRHIAPMIPLPVTVRLKPVERPASP